MAYTNTFQRTMIWGLVALLVVSALPISISFAQTDTVPSAPTINSAAYSTENLGQREVRLIVISPATNATYDQLYWHLSGTAWPNTAPKDTYITSSTWTQPANVGGIQIFAPSVGGTYEYRLDACNAAGCTPSNVISITVPSATPAAPNAPTNFTAMPTAGATSSSVSLAWSTSSTPSVVYKIRYQYTMMTTWDENMWNSATALPDSSSTSTTATGLTSNSTFVFAIRAVANGMNSAIVASPVVTTSAPPAPSAPTTFTQSGSATTDSISFTVTPASGNSGEQFRIFYKTRAAGAAAYDFSSTTSWSTLADQLFSTAATAQPLKVIGLTAGTTYDFAVKTVTSGGFSSYITTSATTASSSTTTTTTLPSGAVTIKGFVREGVGAATPGAGVANALLRLSVGSASATTTADSTGYYHFDNLGPATYGLHVDPPSTRTNLQAQDNAVTFTISSGGPVNWDVALPPTSTVMSACTLTMDKPSYPSDATTIANYTYTCQGSVTSTAIEVAKPDGTVVQYNSGTRGLSSNPYTQQMGFGTSNLLAGVHTLRLCVLSTATPCPSSSAVSVQFTITSTTTPPSTTGTAAPEPTTNDPGVWAQVEVATGNIMSSAVCTKNVCGLNGEYHGYVPPSSFQSGSTWWPTSKRYIWQMAGQAGYGSGSFNFNTNVFTVPGGTIYNGVFTATANTTTTPTPTPSTGSHGSLLDVASVTDLLNKIWGPGSNGIILGGGLNFSTQPGVGWSQQYGGKYVTAYSMQGVGSQYVAPTAAMNVSVTGPAGSIVEVWDLETLTVVAANSANPGSATVFTAQPNHRYGGFAWYADNAKKDIEIHATSTSLTPTSTPVTTQTTGTARIRVTVKENTGGNSNTSPVVADANATLTKNGSLVASGPTSGTGLIEFTNLAAGTYALNVIPLPSSGLGPLGAMTVTLTEGMTYTNTVFLGKSTTTTPTPNTNMLPTGAGGIKIIVKDYLGAPVPNASVGLCVSSGTMTCGGGQADAAGVYQFTNILPGSYLLGVGVTATRSDLQSIGQLPVIVTAAAQEFPVTLQKNTSTVTSSVPVPQPEVCSMKSALVCGELDGQRMVYGNQCFLEKAGAKYIQGESCSVPQVKKEQNPNEKSVKNIDQEMQVFQRALKKGKSAVLQFMRRVARAKTEIASHAVILKKCGLAIPSELTSALVVADYLDDLIAKAKTVDDLDVITDTIESTTEAIRYWGPKLGDLRGLCTMMTRATNELKTLDRESTTLDKTVKANKKIDLRDLADAFKEKVAELRVVFTRVRDEAQTDADVARDTIENDFFGQFDNIANARQAIRAAINGEKEFRALEQDLAQIRRKVSTLERTKKIEASTLVHVRELMASVIKGIADARSSLKQKKLDPDEVVNAVQDLFDAREQLYDALQDTSAAPSVIVPRFKKEAGVSF